MAVKQGAANAAGKQATSTAVMNAYQKHKKAFRDEKLRSKWSPADGNHTLLIVNPGEVQTRDFKNKAGKVLNEIYRTVTFKQLDGETIEDGKDREFKVKLRCCEGEYSFSGELKALASVLAGHQVDDIEEAFNLIGGATNGEAIITNVWRKDPKYPNYDFQALAPGSGGDDDGGDENPPEADDDDGGGDEPEPAPKAKPKGKAAKAAPETTNSAQFDVGDDVEFEDEDGDPMVGEVVTVNNKKQMLTVETPDGASHEVPFDQATAVQPGE